MITKNLLEANDKLDLISNERQSKALLAIIKAAHEKIAGHSIDLEDFQELDNETADDAVLTLEAMWFACLELKEMGAG